MPRDTQILRSAPADAPKDYTIDKNVELILHQVSATFKDNGAASDWLPCVDLISDSGHRIARCCDPNVKVTAGEDAEASWFPGGRPLGGSSSSTTPAASAYLWTQTSKTFTGSNGFSMTWDHFQTTDTTVFGTDPFNQTFTPPNNQPGDVNLICLKDGAYIAELRITWKTGTTNFYGQIQGLTVDYETDGGPQAAGDLAATTPPMTAEGDYRTYDMRAFTTPAGWGGFAIYALAEGQTATPYTVTEYSMVVHYLGGGIGADNAVY